MEVLLPVCKTCAIFLFIILSTCVIFPHEVTKCSQLGLVLLCYKEDDAPHFHQNLRISPHMFNVLMSLIQDSTCFQNNSLNEQMPIPSHPIPTCHHLLLDWSFW